MASNSRKPRIVHFGDCVLDLDTAELRRNGTKSLLQSQPFQILTLLLENPGQLVTREELIQRLWPAGTFVDFDQSLNKAIARLRETLCDNAEQPAFIETLPRRGYRFIATVESNRRDDGGIQSAAWEQVASSENSAVALQPSIIVRGEHNKRARWIFGLTSLCVIAGAFTLWRWWTGSKVGAHHATTVIKQLTANAPGDPVGNVAFSRDGRNLAYYNDLSGKIYVLEIDSGELRELTTPEASTPWGWFPDESHLLVVQHEKRGVWKMSVWGGTYQRIVDGEAYFPTLSPDGSYIAFFRKDFASIWLAASDGTGQHEALSLNSEEFEGFGGTLAWSPRSRLLLFTRLRPNGDWTIESCDLQGGHHTTIVSDLRAGRSPILYWLPDGRIVYSVTDPYRHNFDMWTLKADPYTGKRLGEPAWLATGESDSPAQILADDNGHRLIYLSSGGSTAIYLADLRTPKTPKAKRLTPDNWDNRPTDWSRDSAAILYSSLKNNKSTIYLQSLDDQTPKVLISGDETYEDASLTPDGHHLLFSALDFANPSSRVMTVPIEGGPRSTLLAGNLESRYSFSCPRIQSESCVLGEVQGKQLIFSFLDTVHGKGAEIKRLDIDAQSAPPDWSLSPDGTRIAIGSFGPDGWIRILTIADQKVAFLPRKGNWERVGSVAWAADGKRLFATAWSDHFYRQALLSIDLEGNAKMIDEVRFWAFGLIGLRASPDGRYLAYGKTISDGNVMMLENF